VYSLKTFLKEQYPGLLAALAKIVVRVIYLLQIRNSPTFHSPLVDQLWHWEWAGDILSGSFWGNGAYFRAPLYAYLLAFLRLITDSSFFWVRLLQVLLSACTAFILVKLAEKLFSRTTAVVAGMIYALYGTLVYFDTTLLIPVLFIFLSVLGIYLLIACRKSSSWITWLMAGLVLGLAAITRPNILAVIPFLILWAVLRDRAVLSKSVRLKTVAIMVLGIILPIIPVTVKNIAKSGDFILISSQGGINFYLGNNPDADGLTVVMPELDRAQLPNWQQFIPTTNAIAERESRRGLSEGEISSFWTHKALDFISDHPGDFLVLTFKKFVYLVSGFEHANNTDIYFDRSQSSLLSILIWRGPVYFPFGLLLPFALAGIWLYRKESYTLWPVYIFLVVYALTVLAFFITARYRLPLVPFLILFASAGIVRLVAVIRERKNLELSTAIVILVISILAVNRTYFDEGFSNQFQNYLSVGAAFERAGKLGEAEQQYKRALEFYPYSGSAYNDLGYVQMMQGKSDQALNSFRTALQYEPDNPKIYKNLGLLMQRQGNLHGALNDFRLAVQKTRPEVTSTEELAQYLLNVAVTYDALKESDSASVYYRLSVSTAPEFGPAYAKAGSFFSREGDYATADSMFAVADSMNALSAGDLFNWGLSLLRRQEHQSARKRLRAAVEKDNGMYQAYYLLAASFEDTGSPPDSVLTYLNLALEYNPTYQPALRLREKLTEEHRR
jgi:tetratricopeptide (TPR) repeat protein